MAKIFKMLLGLALPGFLARTFQLSCRGGVVVDAPTMHLKQPPMVVFAHGYLGSRFDMLHLAELLVSKGFVVAAPEFAESLSASFEPSATTTRGAIMDAALRKLRADFGPGKLGLVGHSAGAGTAIALSGAFPLGRAAIAGGGFGYSGDDPLMVVSSEGDCLFRRRWADIRAIASTPTSAVAVYSNAQGAMTLASSAYAAYPKRAALLFDDDSSAAAPSHISFLDPRSNDAMTEFLSPLLPLAQLLRVPVLDFDVYQERRDSEATAEVVLPALSRFFESRA